MIPLKLMLLQYLGALGWAVVGAVSMGLSLAIGFKLFTILTPGIAEIEELRKGNIGVAIVLAAVIVAMGLGVAVTVIPEAHLVSP